MNAESSLRPALDTMSHATHSPLRSSKVLPALVDNPLHFTPTASEGALAGQPTPLKLTETAANTADPILFRCDQCPRSFTRRENLARHSKSHNILRTHRCKLCGKGFTRSDLLHRHEAGHPRWDKQAEIRQNSNTSKRRKTVATEINSLSPEELHPSSNQPPSSYHQRTEATREPRMVAGPLRSSHDDFESIPNAFGTMAEFNSEAWNHSGQTQTAADLNKITSLDVALPQNHQYHAAPIPHVSATGFMPDSESLSLMPFDSFDFSSIFLNPENDGLMDASNEWFSKDFYSAMREVDNNYEQMETMIGANFTPSELDNHSFVISNQVANTVSGFDNIVNPLFDTRLPNNHANDGSLIQEPDLERTIRLSSPPNEVSEEDKWPFAWNPKSKRILVAEPVSIPVTHPFWKSHNPRFDISESTLLRLKAFLSVPAGLELHMSQTATVQLPSLPEINIFIGLFFERFSLQMPVLHHATVDTNFDLPPPLLAIMVVIGATYSRVQHSRRFSIVLLDIVRWNLQIALECDNSLMRDPMIIFTEALICHAGLWCGNKRAFELAEIVRAVVVKHIRTFRFRAGGSQTQEQTTFVQSGKEASISRWRKWIEAESQRRLYWVIYTIDCQFASLLNLPPTIAIGEIRNLGCPCDDEFWLATSARNWRNLLGPALVPPSRVFSAAAAPFIIFSSSEGRDSNLNIIKRNGTANDSEQLPVLDLNTWSAFLVLMSIHCLIFHFGQDTIFTDSVLLNSDEIHEDKDSQHAHTTSSDDREKHELNDFDKWYKRRRGQLQSSLSSWAAAYQSLRESKNSQSSSYYFHKSSLVLHHLALINLDVPLTYLQNAIGKEGKNGISQAMSSLRVWISETGRLSEETVYDAIVTIVSLTPKKERHSVDFVNPIDTEPYSIITLFLSHIVFWIHATVSNNDQKKRLLEMISKNESLVTSPLYSILNTTLEAEDHGRGSDAQQDARLIRQRLQKVVFKSAAELLTGLGTWGASLNLALMLYRRAEM